MHTRAPYRLSPTRLAAIAAAVSLLLSSAGCALIRQDKAPAARISAEQVRLARDSQLPQGDWPSTEWWRTYADDRLDALVARALQDSPTMAVAQARVEASRAQAKLVDASIGLLVGLSASVNRQRLSENGFLGPFAHTNPEIGTTGPWYTEGTVGLVAGYEVDLWGKNRARVDAAMGVTRASQAEAAQAALLLSSQVVHAYYDIQATYALRDLLVKAREIRQEQVQASRARAARGLVARTQVESAEAQRLQLEQQISSAQARIRTLHEVLRLLTGAGPDGLSTITQQPLPDGVGGVPPTLGYELYDPATGSWSQVGSLEQMREQHTATLLADGRVIVAGGIGRGILSYTELFH